MLPTATITLESGVYHDRPIPLTPLLKSQRQSPSIQDHNAYLFFM